MILESLLRLKRQEHYLPSFHHSYWICENECHKPCHWGGHQMFSCRQLIQRILLLHPRLYRLVKQEIRPPGTACSHHIGCHPSVQSSYSLGLDDGGHGVANGCVLGSAVTTIIHSKSAKMMMVRTFWRMTLEYLILSRSRGWSRSVDTTPPDMPAIMCLTWTWPTRFIRPGGRLLLLMVGPLELTFSWDEMDQLNMF